MALTMSRLPGYMATAKSLFVGASISEVNRVTGMRILGDDGILSLGFLSAVIEYRGEVTLLTFLILRVVLLFLKRVVDVVFLNLCARCIKNKMQAAVVVLGGILRTNIFSERICNVIYCNYGISLCKRRTYEQENIKRTYDQGQLLVWGSYE